MKTGIEILNNFSDMFAKMLDPLDGAQGGDSPSTSSCPFDPLMRKGSTTSMQSTNSKKSNDSMKSNDIPKTQESKQNSEQVTKEAEKTEDATKKSVSNNSLVDIMDLGSDSESDNALEDFVKLNAPTKENTPEKAVDISLSASSSGASMSTSKGTTPPQSLNKSDVMDFAQLSADLKAHIAQELQKNVNSEKENPTPTAPAPAVPVAEWRAVPVFNTTPNTNSTAPPKEPANKPQEESNVPVYHAGK